jgi:hypothetical protein
MAVPPDILHKVLLSLRLDSSFWVSSRAEDMYSDDTEGYAFMTAELAAQHHLAQVALVCRYWNESATPLLYSTPVLASLVALKSFYHTTKTRVDFAFLVNHITVYDLSMSEKSKMPCGAMWGLVGLALPQVKPWLES